MTNLILIAAIIGIGLLLAWGVLHASAGPEPRQFPTLDEVRRASDEQILFWMNTLPSACTRSELKVVEAIIRRARLIKNLKK
ncbi:MAG: hypothetical protein ACK5JD_11010 [Mangrovibacterium sp.]